MSKTDLNTGQRKLFADQVVKAINALIEEYGLESMVVNRGNPMVIATRGCLTDPEHPERKDPIELVIQISDNLAEAQKADLQVANVEQVASSAQIYRSFDTSESIANDAAGRGSPRDTDDPCNDDRPSNRID